MKEDLESKLELLISGLAESRKDIREAAQHLGPREVRYLVQAYYQTQLFRIAAAGMARSLTKDDKPCLMVGFLAESQARIEKDIKLSLYVAADNSPVGRWLMGIHGIGEVLACGLMSNIDIERAPTAGSIWKLGGYDPSLEWKKGQRRPYSADLKTLFFKIGDSFVKSSGSPKSVYGPIYRQRKEKEVAQNERGEFSELAAETLEKRTFRDKAVKDLYESGKLPPGRIDLRARRVAVKLFLSHLHDVMTWYRYGRRAPAPYAITVLGHADQIACPNPPWPEGTPSAAVVERKIA